VFFALFMSIGSPVLAMILMAVVQGSFLSRFAEGPFSNPVYRLNTGHVLVHDISKEAHSTKEQYFLDLEKDAKETERDIKEKLFRLFLLSTSCCVLSAFDLIYSQGLLWRIAQAVAERDHLWILVLPFAFLGAAVFFALWEDKPVLVYCPSLAQKLREDLRPPTAPPTGNLGGNIGLSPAPGRTLGSRFGPSIGPG